MLVFFSKTEYFWKSGVLYRWRWAHVWIEWIGEVLNSWKKRPKKVIHNQENSRLGRGEIRVGPAQKKTTKCTYLLRSTNCATKEYPKTRRRRWPFSNLLKFLAWRHRDVTVTSHWFSDWILLFAQIQKTQTKLPGADSATKNNLVFLGAANIFFQQTRQQQKLLYHLVGILHVEQAPGKRTFPRKSCQHKKEMLSVGYFPALILPDWCWRNSHQTLFLCCHDIAEIPVAAEEKEVEKPTGKLALNFVWSVE